MHEYYAYCTHLHTYVDIYVGVFTLSFILYAWILCMYQCIKIAIILIFMWKTIQKSEIFLKVCWYKDFN